MRKNDDHPYAQTVRAYYRGCNSADEELMKSTFTEDVIHYFVDHAAVRGARELAHYWAIVGPRTQAQWSLDQMIVQDDEAVIEWTMKWVPPQTGVAEILRGAEWYVFREGLIAEIRSYHCNFHLRAPENAELHDFPYEARSYTSRGLG